MQHLQVMDLTAATLCNDNNINILVFDMGVKGNIKKIMEGAAQAFNDLSKDKIEENPAYKYAIYRHLLNTKLGKKIE